MSFMGGIVGNDNTATLRHFGIGTFTFDVVTEETFQQTWTKSESAVEVGAKISDHRIRNPQEIMIRGVVVNYEIYDFVGDVFPELNPLLNKIGLPIQVSSITDYTIATVNRYAGTARKYVNIGSRAIKTYGRLSEAKSLLDIPSLLNDKSATDDRITRVKKTLEAIANSEILIEVMTSTGVYTGIQISAIAVSRNDHGSAEFSLVLSEMPQYEVETVSGINAKVNAASTQASEKKSADAKTTSPVGQTKTAKATTQSAPPQNKGTATVQKTKRSALRTIVLGGKGLF